MSIKRARHVRAAAAALALTLSMTAVAHGQGRTDVVTLANGDRITGEVIRLERGRLEFKTDDVGTLYFEWDKLVSVVANRFVEAMTRDGVRYFGTLERGPDRTIAVSGPTGVQTLPMNEVTLITPIGRSFWSKLDGSIDLGFSYTRSSGVAQLNLNWDTVYRKPASSTSLTASFTQTAQDDEDERDDRGYVELAYLRYPWKRWFVTGLGRFETNESLGLDLRSQAAFAVGPRLINSTRAQMAAGAGVAVNDERGVDVESTRNVEALFVFATSYYTYDRPKTNLDINLQYYPSLSEPGRHRVQFDGSAKRELWKDFFVALTVYNSYDNRPPNPAANSNDVGIVLSLGWSY
jgi:hypothetical protein